MSENRKEMQQLLSEEVVHVKFTKKDGDTRLMNCTRAEKFIPTDKRPKSGNEKKNEALEVVFDVDINEWRCFRWNSVIEWQSKVEV